MPERAADAGHGDQHADHDARHDAGDGMAPNAKLVMQDVGDASGGDEAVAFQVFFHWPERDDLPVLPTVFAFPVIGPS